MLNHSRFINDLAPLNEFSQIGFIIFPSWLQTLLNSVGLDATHTRKDYLKGENPEVVGDRKQLSGFLSNYLSFLQRFLSFNGVITCSFYYVQDQEWDKAATKASIPFIAIYKENLKYETRGEYSVELYQERGYRFFGSKLLVFDFLSKGILARAGVAHPDKIKVIGIPRCDLLWKKSQNTGKGMNARPMALLFSFRHAIGGTLTADNHFDNCFSPDGSRGACLLFDQVHAGFAQLALDNPDVDFVIKTKWAGKWFNYIESSVERLTGRKTSEIPNLHLDYSTPAQDLIQRSNIVVGLNSTTLIESLALGKHTVIPYFAEVSEKYPQEVYFKDFFHCFSVAKSFEEYKKMISDNCRRSDERSLVDHRVIERYMGFFDGKNFQRFEREVTSLLVTNVEV